VGIDRKLEALHQVLELYAEVIGPVETACRPGCSRCCTDRVTVTTLEAHALLESLTPPDAARLRQRIGPARGDRPRIVVTINALAELCAEGREPPDAEEADAGRCPLLAGDLCPIYPLRPFNCRCFVSRITCADQGYAEVDEATVAVNTLFLQVIEHIDAGGCTGLLPDVVRMLADPLHRRAYREGSLECEGCGLTPNRPLRVLMVPPEHRGRIEPLIERLQRIRV
jgi:Fe-S-cluster containining protein